MTMEDLGPTLLDSKFTPKGWGGEKLIDNNKNYCGKILYIMKGCRCSIHYHIDKTETFYLHKGRLEVRYFDDPAELERIVAANPGISAAQLYDIMEVVILGQGDVFKVPPYRAHQMIGLEDSELFEFSTEHKEEDSYRIVKGD